MFSLAEIESLLLALATAGYIIAMGVYWKSILSGRDTTGWWASRIALGALLVHVVWLGTRTYHLGFLPLYSGHDFSSTLAAGAVIAILIFERLSQRRDLGAFAMPVAVVLLAYAWTLPRTAAPLIQIFNSYWLTIHIIVVVIAYACFAATFAASCLYLVRARTNSIGNTTSASPNSLAKIDRIAYRVTFIGFTFMTICIITGAIWAESAFGRYWAWDSKETLSLITWLVFAAYLHVRYHRGWSQKKAAILAIVGFLTVLMNFFGVEMLYQ
jgi:cytochrome c-type biogenesis protein CcsB